MMATAKQAPKKRIPPAPEPAPTAAPAPEPERKEAQIGVVDKVWFQEQLDHNMTSARQLAKKMNIDPSAMSLLLSGKRRMKSDEAAAIAVHLNVPLSEVMTRAGIPMAGLARPTISVSVPGNMTVRVDIPPGITPAGWDLAARYIAQYVAADVAAAKNGQKG